jgi:transcriptional regulator with XRE-family HTH domain
MAGKKTVSDRLRRAISESGLSLNELAERSGTDKGRLSRFMRGERGLTLDTVDKLAGVLRLRLTPEPGPGTPKRRQGR